MLVMKFASLIVNRFLKNSFMEESLGDLWESHYKFKNNFLTIWRAIQLVFASYQIHYEETRENRKKSPNKNYHRIKNVLKKVKRLLGLLAHSSVCLRNFII